MNVNASFHDTAHYINLSSLLTYYSTKVPFINEEQCNIVKENMNRIREISLNFAHIAPQDNGYIYIHNNKIEKKINIDIFTDLLAAGNETQQCNNTYMTIYKARKLSMLWNIDDLRGIGHKPSAPLTLGELCAVIYRYMEVDGHDDMTDTLAKTDMPYRTKSWIKKVVEKLTPQLEALFAHNNNVDILESFFGNADLVFSQVDTWEECLIHGGTCQP